MEEIILIIGQMVLAGALAFGVAALTAWVFGPRSKKGGRNG